MLLSTSDDPAIIQESLKWGANGYITKPRSMNEYVAIFDQHFAPILAVESSQWPDRNSRQLDD